VAPVTGGHIAADQGRLDFAIDLSRLDAARIERELNALLERAVDTETVWITDAELDAQPERVNTLRVSPPRGAGRVRLLRIPGIDLPNPEGKPPDQSSSFRPGFADNAARSSSQRVAPNRMILSCRTKFSDISASSKA
jgi:hypothetical protein